MWKMRCGCTLVDGIPWRCERHTVIELSCGCRQMDAFVISCKNHSRVAQLEEYRALNATVAGSNPAAGSERKTPSKGQTMKEGNGTVMARILGNDYAGTVETTPDERGYCIVNVSDYGQKIGVHKDFLRPRDERAIAIIMGNDS